MASAHGRWQIVVDTSKRSFNQFPAMKATIKKKKNSSSTIINNIVMENILWLFGFVINSTLPHHFLYLLPTLVSWDSFELGLPNGKRRPKSHWCWTEQYFLLQFYNLFLSRSEVGFPNLFLREGEWGEEGHCISEDDHISDYFLHLKSLKLWLLAILVTKRWWWW